MPGGFVNEGESLEQAVIREAEEEIGTIVIKPQYITSLPATYDHLGITHNLVLILFRANLQDESTLRQTEEAFNYTFFAKKDLPENIAFDAQRAFLRTYVVRS